MSFMFLKKTYQSHCQYGQKKITIYIEPAFTQRYPAVVFDFFSDDRVWTVCWVIDVSWEQFFDTANLLHLSHDEFEKALHDTSCNKQFYEALRELSPIHSQRVDEKTAKLLNELCKNGLKKPKSIPRGLDGHDYHIMIDGFPAEYWCWCSLPDEWKKLEPIISQCVDYAQLDPDRYGTSREREEHRNDEFAINIR